MAEMKLTIFGPLGASEVIPDPEGTTFGRSSRCQVELDSRDVSREHARISRDPFGRWIVEDLGSSNGTFIAGRRIESSHISTGEPIGIGPFSVIMSEHVDTAVQAVDTDDPPANIVIEDFETEFLYGQQGTLPETDDWQQRLANIRTRLESLASASALYAELCRCLAWSNKSVATILRLPIEGQLGKSPEILACAFGASYETEEVRAAGAFPTPLAFRVSHRVLEKVRNKRQAILAKSIYSSDIEVTMAIVDEHSPRAVICTPLTSEGDPIDVLYLDIPIDSSAGASPEQVFAFVNAICGSVASKCRDLIPLQLKTARSNLDHELSLARDIQLRFAPAIDESWTACRIGVHYKPAIWVGGDYCDIWNLDNGSFAVAVGEIDAMGVDAAMLIPELRALLRTSIRYNPEPLKALQYVHTYLRNDESHGMCVGMFLAVVNPAERCLDFANAGGPQPILQINGKPAPLAGDNGERLGATDFAVVEGKKDCESDCRLVICTSGVTQAASPDGTGLGLEGLAQVLRKYSSRKVDHLPKMIAEFVRDFKAGAAQRDDITIVAIEV